MIYRFDSIPHNLIKHIGGKASNLLRLSKSGFNVPDWYVIPASYFERYYEGSRMDNLKAQFNKGLKIDELSRSLKGVILHDGTLKENIERDIIRVIDEDIFPVSVRSSALNEDSEALSYAGQFSTFLNVTDKNSLSEYILQCLASQYDRRNMVYKRLNKQEKIFQGLAVIIQKMVSSQKSGIIFTADPTTGNKNKIVINGSYGQGEGVVSDSVKSDMYVYDKIENKFEYRIESKKEFVDLNEKGGLIKRSVAEDKIDQPVFTEVELKEIINTASKIEDIFGTPQDIEFAMDKEKIYILQARSITTKVTDERDELIWDNSNIVESFSGPTTPLTFSFANEAYSIIYRLMCLKLGVSKNTIDENKMIYTNMIGFINNRIYYSLNSWFTALSFLPAYKYNKEFMEKMMGVKSEFKGKLIKKENGTNRFFGKLSLLKLTGSIFISYITHGKNIRKFKKTYEHAVKEFTIDIDQCKDSREAIDLYIKLKNTLLSKWITPVINDTFAMVFYGLLGKFLEKISRNRNEKLQNNLLAGEDNIESVEVTVLLYGIAEKIKKNREALKLINNLSAVEFLERIKSDNRFIDIYKEFSCYINKFGSRCVHELKLEMPNLRDEPERIIPLIKNYVNRKDFDNESIFRKEKEIRRDAENSVSEELNKYHFPKSYILKIIFGYLLRNTRYFIRNRENMRFIRTNVFGMVKIIFRKIGKEFKSAGILEDEKDIFFLTVDEIISYVYGTSVTLNLKELVNLRKKEYEKNFLRELPERFRTGFIPYTDIPREKISNKGNLSGIGCSPGNVKGTVDIVESPYIEKARGEILVAEKTDPGWLPVFPLYKGIILERGSVLSHSAIVARELGIPVIVGVRGVTNNLKNGDLIEMNGSTGEIDVLTRRKGGS